MLTFNPDTGHININTITLIPSVSIYCDILVMCFHVCYRSNGYLQVWLKHVLHRRYFFNPCRYVLSDYLLTPVKYESTDAEIQFNKWHKRTRSAVERSIGVLKQRWR